MVRMSNANSGGTGWHGGKRRGYGWRFLNQFKVVNGRKFQLHATRGWKCIGRVAA